MSYAPKQNFDSDESLKYSPGDFYFGEDKHGNELGVKSEKHAITIASARTGKGVGVIIPNLLRWPDSALVVDPKGEAAEATAEAREAMGQDVHVLDPFNTANVPERFRKRLNLLAELDPNSPRIREDINVIADGLLMRHDANAGHWDGGGLSVMAGLIAHALTGQHNYPKSLATVREFLNADPDRFAGIIEEMQENRSCGKLATSAASKLTKSGNEAGHFLSVADENTKWLDSDPIAEFLDQSDFAFSDLKKKKTTIYLVLPVDLLDEHGRFLRLFVRYALSLMAQRINGSLKGERCLFLLDEFAALGHVSEIAKASGLMPGYGVHLWPFLQDIGQLYNLYGKDTAHTFFGSADLHQFFGNADQPSLEYISKSIGNISQNDFPGIMEMVKDQIMSTEDLMSVKDADIRGIHTKHNIAVVNDTRNIINSYIGKPRMPPEAVAEIIAKTDRPVANASINFIQGHRRTIALLKPFFEESSRKPHIDPYSGYDLDLMETFDFENMDLDDFSDPVEVERRRKAGLYEPDFNIDEWITADPASIERIERYWQEKHEQDLRDKRLFGKKGLIGGFFRYF